MDILDNDGVEPDCFSKQCIIPDPDLAGLRILAIRHRLANLHELGIGSEILRMYEADLEDLELLAWLEEKIKKMQPSAKGKGQ